MDDYKKLKSKTGKFLNKLVIGHVDGSSTEESSGSEQLLYSSQSAADRRQFTVDAAHVHIVTVNTVPINKAEYLDYPTIVCSAGVLSFETTSYATGDSRAMIKRLDFNPESKEDGGKSDYNGFDLATSTDRDCFIKSFRMNYPTLCEGRTLFVLDSDKLKMKEYENHLEHIGKHLAMMQEMTSCENFGDVNKSLASINPNQKNLVICADTMGRYRSVTHAELISDPLEGILFPQTIRGHNVKVLHLSDLDYWQRTCQGKCANCHRDDREGKNSERDLRRHAKDILQKIVSKPVYSASKAPPTRPASSRDSVRRTATEPAGVKGEPGEPSISPTRSFKGTGSDEAKHEFFMICEDIIYEKGDIGVVNVIDKLREVFSPRLSLFEIIRDNGGGKDPTECLWSYKNRYDVPQRQITEMLMMQQEKKGERARPAVFITDEQRKYMQSQVRSGRGLRPDKSRSRSRARSPSSPTRSRSPAPTDPRPPRRGRTPVKKEEAVKDDGYGPSTADFVAAVACDIIDSRKDLAKEVIAACDDMAPEQEPSQSSRYSGPNPSIPEAEEPPEWGSEESEDFEE